MNTRHSGFTLIELIVVIVILGILAATAIPRFSDLSVNARVASADGLEGAMRSASALAHAQALVDGVETGAISMEGETVNVTNAYADATSVGIGAALEVSGDSIDCSIAENPFTCRIDGVAGCEVTYNAGAPPTINNLADTTTCE